MAVTSSVIPYSLNLEALRRIPPRVFGVLTSLEPAAGALFGLLILGQLLHKDLRVLPGRQDPQVVLCLLCCAWRANRPMDTRKPPTGVGTADGFQELVVRLCVTARPGHSRPSSRYPPGHPKEYPTPYLR